MSLVVWEGEALTHLNEPSSLPEAVETELIGDFSGIHSIGKILLVGEDEEEGVTELILIEHALKLLTGFGYTLAIIGVNHKDNALSILEVWSVSVSVRWSGRMKTADRDAQCLQRGRILSCPVSVRLRIGYFICHRCCSIPPTSQTRKADATRVRNTPLYRNE